MKELPDAYPLKWPINRKRTPSSERTRAKFSRKAKQDGRSYLTARELTLAEARNRVLAELNRLGVDEVVISSDVALRLDGLPRSGSRIPDDPGVAVYFRWRENVSVMAVDKYDTISGNLAAIAAHVEATRGQLRWGVVEDVGIALAGVPLLPAASRVLPWWEILRFRTKPARYGLVRARWHAMIRKEHPDRGGNQNRAAEIDAAHYQGLKELGGDRSLPGKKSHLVKDQNFSFCGLGRDSIATVAETLTLSIVDLERASNPCFDCLDAALEADT